MAHRRTTHNARRATNLYAVILVGGKGKRLRPLSTDEHPKAFLSVTKNRKSMFANTVSRVRKLIPSSRIVVVANKAHARLVRKEFPQLSGKNLLLEPVSRNTAPAVGYAAAVIAARDRDAVMAILPTDHYIRDERRQLEAIAAGADFLERNKDAIIVFGIKPTFPSTGFGYIKIAKRRAATTAGVSRVERFVEKPGSGTARRYLRSRAYLWNSGAFLFSAGRLLEEMRVSAPAIYRNLRDVKRLGKRYAGMPDISLDYAVMEKAKKIYCIRGSYGWNDLGSFEALKKVLKRESRKFVEAGGKVLRIP